MVPDFVYSFVSADSLEKLLNGVIGALAWLAMSYVARGIRWMRGETVLSAVGKKLLDHLRYDTAWKADGCWRIRNTTGIEVDMNGSGKLNHVVVGGTFITGMLSRGERRQISKAAADVYRSFEEADRRKQAEDVRKSLGI